MKYRNCPETISDKMCLTDGGLETVLIFNHGIELPEFASYTIFERDDGESILRHYLQPYIDLALESKTAFQLVDSGWRASSNWGTKLGLNSNQLEKIIRSSVTLMSEIRAENETDSSPMPIIGCIGPVGDGYQPGEMLSADEARTYHLPQIKILTDTETDFLTAMTLSYPEEGIGIIEAAKSHSMPVTISFTVETDGRLPSGKPLDEAIDQCDVETGSYAMGYMINCAHPSHFRRTLEAGGDWVNRIRGIRPNASKMSHEELDNAEKLDRGNPQEFGREVAELLSLAPEIRVIGGCCGTDIEHLTALASELSPA